ncbi:MAG: septum formation initiator family protein [Lachnospiraceae bacterium]|nr:septum formation initiator family protein [Lachnospiraceae bacterium]
MVTDPTKKKSSPLGLWIVALVVILICVFLIFKIKEVNDELESKQQQLIEYNKAIEQAQEKSLEMEEEIRFRSTDDYIEEAARDIGLIDPDETIITPEE